MSETVGEIVPFPLRRRFLVYVLPGLLLTGLGVLLVVAQALATTAERLYEREAAAKQKLVLTALATADAGVWSDLVGRRRTGEEAVAQLHTELADEARELGFDCIAIRGPDRRVIIATATDGCSDERDREWPPLGAPGDTAFREARTKRPQWIVASLVEDRVSGSNLILVTRETAARQELLIGSTSMVWLGLLVSLYAFILAVTIWLVTRAQGEIVARTNALNEARRSLARFVSRHGRARAAVSDARARRLEATVLFLDVRDFSSFAEVSTPEESAALVEAVASIAFERILAAGGDVDRLLGDGLIAWFEGADRKRRAWRSVADIIPAFERAALPRGVGFGLHYGDVVEATIGAGERLDQTILGRTVNIAARLCANASSGEVVASLAMGPPPPEVRATSSHEEALDLKGMSSPLRCLRLSGVTWEADAADDDGNV